MIRLSRSRRYVVLNNGQMIGVEQFVVVPLFVAFVLALIFGA